MTAGDGKRREPTVGAGQLDLILSHDIANHLSVILGTTDLLIDGADEEETVDHLATIKRQASAASAMLETVGGVARGGAHAELESVTLGPILATEVERLDSVYSNTEFDLETEDNLQVQADGLLTSVVTNLLENAVEHNDSPSPVVSVHARRADEKVLLSIRDNGSGLPDEVHDQLVGRGLAPPKTGVQIIRYLVEKYDGCIEVETNADGTTTEVAFQGARSAR